MPRFSLCKHTLVFGLLLLAADIACAKPIVAAKKHAAAVAPVTAVATVVGATEVETPEDNYQREALMATMVCSILFGAKRFVRAPLSQAVESAAAPVSKRRVLL
jgi:predicted cobalt transporter CbtA